MYGHFVPQVYQKAWHTSNGKKNVYYFDKKDLSQPLKQEGGNIENNLGKEDLYIFSSIDNANGSTSTGEQLEKEFNNKLETNWNSVLEGIKNLVASFRVALMPNKIWAVRQSDLPHHLLDNLLSFIVLQYFRIKDNFVKADKGYTKLILECCQTSISSILGLDKSSLPDLSKDEDYYNTVWKTLLVDCFDPSCRTDSLLGVLLREYKKLRVVVFTDATTSPTLLLGDNPVIMNTGEVQPIKELQSGIFMPINPNTLVALLNMERDDSPIEDWLFINANTNFFKYINHLLINQAESQVGFCEKTVSHLVSSSFGKSDWNSMFS